VTGAVTFGLGWVAGFVLGFIIARTNRDERRAAERRHPARRPPVGLYRPER